MVGADQDVVNAGRQELPDDGEGALPRAGEVLELRAAAVEDRLSQRVAFVDVQERLVVRIVRETSRRATDSVPGAARRAGSEGAGGATADPAATSTVRPFRLERTAVGGDGKSRRQQVHDRAGALRERRRARAGARAARRSDRARRRRCGRRACRRSWRSALCRLQAQVEIAERHRMSERRRSGETASRTQRPQRTRRRCASRHWLARSRLAMVAYGNGDRARRVSLPRTTCRSTRQRALVDAVPRARRRRRPGLRARRARRRQDARAHAVPRPSLERQDLSVRADAHRLRRPAGAAAAGRASRAWRATSRASAGHDARRRPLHPQLLRRRRPHGAAPGQGRERALDCGRATGRLGVARRHGALSVRRACVARIRWRRCRSSRATRSCSAAPRGCAITVCRASCPAPRRRSSA